MTEDRPSVATFEVGDGSSAASQARSVRASERAQSMLRQSVAMTTASLINTASMINPRTPSIYLAVNREDNAEVMARGQSTTQTTAVNLITVMVGAGVLSYPALFASVGIPIGTLLLSICAPLSYFVCTLLGQAIHNCQLRTGQRMQKLDDVAEACFGRAGAIMAKVFLNIFLASKVAVYMVLIGRNLSFLIPILPYRGWVLAMTLYMLPVAFMRDISFVEKCSVIGLVSVFIYFVTIVCGSMKNALFFEDGDSLDWRPKQLDTVFSVLTAMLFGFGPTDVLTTVRRDMETPEELPKALSLSHGVVFLMYFTAGLGGYLGFGRDVEGNISESMCDPPGCPSVLDNPEDAGRKWLWGYGLAFAVIMNLLVTIPILLYCLFSGIEASYTQEEPMSPLHNKLMRVGVVLAAMLVGIFLPFFLSAVKIMSAALVVPIVLFAPVALAFKSQLDLGRKPPLGNVAIYAGLVLLGVLSLCIGLEESVEGLIKEIEKNPSAADPISNFWK